MCSTCVYSLQCTLYTVLCVHEYHIFMYVVLDMDIGQANAVNKMIINFKMHFFSFISIIHLTSSVPAGAVVVVVDFYIFIHSFISFVATNLSHQ